tara:strand:+ start:3797 stop:4012 length:216 start_codon:yes stop_codon:yes gene_type:complete
MALLPVHAPDAEQDVASVEDQVKVTTVSTRTDEEEADIEAVGTGSGGVPPPPPPPQDVIIKPEKTRKQNLL